MLLCLHEESAVAIAHGYAKVTGKAMAAAVHSNVGLFHATMAIFNAWCDRHAGHRARRHRPGRRRQAPAVDRLDPHRARPGRDRAQLHQMGRPARLPRGRPRGAPPRRPGSPTPRRWGRSTSTSTPRCRRQSSPSRSRRSTRRASCRTPIRRLRAELIQQAAAMLKAAKHPVILMGRVSRSLDGWNAAHRARRDAQRQGDQRPQDRLRLSDRSSAARRRPGFERDRCPRRSRRSKRRT